MTLYDPVGVELKVVMVNVLEKVGEPAHVGLPVQPPVKEGEAPAGSPLTESVTGWDVPLTILTVIVLKPEPPWTRLISPEFDREKSNGALTVKDRVCV